MAWGSKERREMEWVSPIQFCLLFLITPWRGPHGYEECPTLTFFPHSNEMGWNQSLTFYRKKRTTLKHWLLSLSSVSLCVTAATDRPVSLMWVITSGHGNESNLWSSFIQLLCLASKPQTVTKSSCLRNFLVGNFPQLQPKFYLSERHSQFFLCSATETWKQLLAIANDHNHFCITWVVVLDHGEMAWSHG